MDYYMRKDNTIRAIEELCKTGCNVDAILHTISLRTECQLSENFVLKHLALLEKRGFIQIETGGRIKWLAKGGMVEKMAQRMAQRTDQKKGIIGIIFRGNSYSTNKRRAIFLIQKLCESGSEDISTIKQKVYNITGGRFDSDFTGKELMQMEDAGLIVIGEGGKIRWDWGDILREESAF